MSGPDPLRAAAASSPERTALVRVGGGPGWSYRRLDREADRLADRLVGAGIRPGDRVAALLPVGPEAVVALHGVPRTGAALAPLHPAWTRLEIEERLRPLRARLFLATRQTEGRLAGALRASGMLVRLELGADGEPGRGSPGGGDRFGRPGPGAGAAAGEGPGVALEALPSGPDGEGLPGPIPGADHTLVATSGTSGRPRIVRLTAENHRAVYRAATRRLGLGPADRWLASLSPAHVGGVALVLRAAATRSTLVLPESAGAGRGGGRGFDAAGFGALADRGIVTRASLVPVMLRRALEARGDRPLPESFGGILLGGAAAAPALVERALELGYRVSPTYGLTEAASQVATATPEEAARRPDTVGRPLDGVRVRIREGEIQVAGPSVSPGYLGEERGVGGAAGDERAGATETGFGPEGWFRTGDAGRLDGEGRLTVVGRLGERIVSGGVTVDPGEVERALRSHPRVRDATVVGVPDEEWGERVAAVVVPDPAPLDPAGSGESAERAGDGALTAEELLRHCRGRLAGPKLPRRIGLVREIPRNPNGKADRDAVRSMLARGEED